MACFEARISFIDDVESSFTADDLAVSVAVFEGFQGGANFHGGSLRGEVFFVKNNFGDFFWGDLLARYELSVFASACLRFLAGALRRGKHALF